MRVTFFQRGPDMGRHSVERVFEITRSALPPEIESRVVVVPYPRARPWELAYNTLCASRAQGDVNHITGDVHYLALGLDPARTVLTILDCGNLVHLTGLRRRFMEKLWYEKPVHRSHAVIAISSYTANEVCRIVPAARGKIHVIHCPVPPDYDYLPKEFDQRDPVILQMGTRRANKNLIRVAQAIQGIPCTLDIVGPLDEEQRRELIQLGVSFRNYVELGADEIRERYILADLVMCASTFEGFGMPIIEAQAIGRPVITSNVASMPEVAGDGACLVDPYSVEEIRATILRVIESEEERERLVQQGLDNVKRFHPTVIARQYMEVYKEVHAS